MTITTQLVCSLAPEWAKQSGAMLTWPHRKSIWADMLDDIDQVFVNVAREIALRERLVITCFDAEHQQYVKTLLKNANANLPNVTTYITPSNDIWVRDHGPVIIHRDGRPEVLDFAFNGWGNKYPSEHDNNITRLLHAQNAFGDTQRRAVNMVLEGGSIEVNGSGTLMTTTSCLLSKGRNPSLTKSDISSQLHELFGLRNILWLDHGHLAGDDTDGHIDTLARFTDTNTICYVSCDDPADEHYTELQAMENQLQSFRDEKGNPYNLISLPWPQSRHAKNDGRRLPATYANFLIINNAVLVPTYDDPADEVALATLKSCFPDRQIVGINCLPVIQWNGSLHCMTMQLPHGVLS